MLLLIITRKKEERKTLARRICKENIKLEKKYKLEHKYIK